MASELSLPRRTMTLGRTYEATPDEVWEMWTTADGIESWWGPDGFEVTVLRIDVRPGGELAYAMQAVAGDQIDFLRKAGMPVRTEHLIKYVEVRPRSCLEYEAVADFIPGVEPYRLHTRLVLEPVPEGVRLMLTFDAMHDDHWTTLMVTGREMELARLARILEERAHA